MVFLLFAFLKIIEKVSHITFEYADDLFHDSFVYNRISVN